MASYPKEYERAIILNDGEALLLRPELATDTEMLWGMFSTLSQESLRFLVNPFPRERIEQWTSKIDYQKTLPIVGVTQETQRQKIVAVASLEFFDVSAEKHKAEFGITVHDKFQNKGIGTTLTNHMIYIARNEGLRKITLKVLTPNKRAIHVYKKCGFKIEAKLRRESFVNKRYYDDYIMSLLL
jgi:RimJ/RimL family protein N-acetyltransferase